MKLKMYRRIEMFFPYNFDLVNLCRDVLPIYGEFHDVEEETKKTPHFTGSLCERRLLKTNS